MLFELSWVCLFVNWRFQLCLDNLPAKKLNISGVKSVTALLEVIGFNPYVLLLADKKVTLHQAVMPVKGFLFRATTIEPTRYLVE